MSADALSRAERINALLTQWRQTAGRLGIAYTTANRAVQRPEELGT